MTRSTPPSAVLSCVLLLAPAFGQGRGIDPSAPPGALLARAADADSSGDLDAEEWAAFVASFPEAGDGVLDGRLVIARTLQPLLDVDGDGELTRADLVTSFVSIDANGDGVLAAGEIAPSTGQRTRGSVANWLLGGISTSAADADGSGDVRADEWSAFLEPVPEGTVAPAVLAAWIAIAEGNVPEVRSAFTPSIFLVTLGANLDADRNGKITTTDLEALLAALDTSGDGALSTEEMRRRPASAGMDRAGWEISEEIAKRAPAMPWQRNLDDALAISRATGKPLLICVNMDDEPASENLAAGRYRDPEFRKLVDGFVPLIVSPDRHAPRDHDDRGRRVPDPKFGRVTSDEHIVIEPELFARYFSERRVAPRHVGVSPRGEVLFDLFLINDLTIIDRTLREHGFYEAEPLDIDQLSDVELLGTPDAGARERLEAHFLEANEAARAGLAALALDPRRDTQHPEIVRLGLLDPSPAVRRVALESVVSHANLAPLDLVPRAMHEADAASRARLASNLRQRAGRTGSAEDRVRARRLARVFSALSASSIIDVGLWRTALAGNGAVGAAEKDPAHADGRLEALANLEARLSERRDDASLHVLRASILVAHARDLIEGRGGGNPTFFLEDARSAAETALELAPGNTLASAALAQACWYLADFHAAGDAAASALSGLIGWAGSPLAADVLDVLAKARTRSLYEAFGGEEEWPQAWVVEAIAAHEVLLAHKAGTPQQAVAGMQLLNALEAQAELQAFARAAVERFPAYTETHNWFRWIVLKNEGAPGLEDAYDNIRFLESNEATGRWYAGNAVLIAAERHAAESRPDDARRAYRKSIREFAESIALEPDFESSANHYIAFAHAGLARIELDAGEPEAALASLRASAEANGKGFLAEDGLGHTALSTARALYAVLGEEGRAELRGMIEVLGLEL